MNACISILQGFLFIPITDDIRVIERLEFVLKKRLLSFKTYRSFQCHQISFRKVQKRGYLGRASNNKTQFYIPAPPLHSDFFKNLQYRTIV